MAIQMGVSIAAVPLLDIKFVNTLVRTAITVVSAITEAFAPPNKFRTKLAISAPPPDTSNPVPRPEIAPIQNSTSHGKSANALFTGRHPVPNMMDAPSMPMMPILRKLLKGANPLSIKHMMQPSMVKRATFPFHAGTCPYVSGVLSGNTA